MILPEIKEKPRFTVTNEKVNKHLLHDFYSVHREKDGKTFKEIVINKVKFVAKLKELGFRRYDLNFIESKYIRVEKNTIEEVSEKFITDTFLQYVEELPDYDHSNGDSCITITSEIVKAKLYNALENYFKPSLFNRMLNDKDIKIKEDTKTEKFLFYQNCWISINKAGYQVHDYSELDGYVWKDMILPRSFTIPADPESVFGKFCYNISCKEPERLKSLQTILGYNLHAWFSGKLKATILTDSRLSEDGEANGRTGKGILCKALGYMLNADVKRSSVYVAINGRDYNPKNINKHADCNLDTRLMHIEDIYNNYNIESSFNDITDGLSVRKLFQSAFTIQVKIIFSTNKTLIVDGESAKDRVIEFELADYYNSNFDPSQEFGHWFFDDWTPEEFNRFDLFMIECVRLYLADGIKEAEEINLRVRKLQDHSSREFINFMDDMFKRGETIKYNVTNLGVTTENELTVKSGDPVNKKLIYEVFRTLNADFNNAKFTQHKFTKWVRMYCKANQIPLGEERRNSKDIFYFDFRKKQTTVPAATPEFPELTSDLPDIE
jgi:hypothetical protein